MAKRTRRGNGASASPRSAPARGADVRPTGSGRAARQRPRTATAPPCRNLVLIGMRGAGKTTVGRQAARLLRWRFIDLDQRIARAAGLSIAEFFRRRGEQAFRRAESEAIHSLARRRGCVISVGGGAVLTADNRRALRRLGLCIWLRAGADELHRRLARDARGAAGRPSLTRLSGPAEVRYLLRRRERLYARTAHGRIDTTGRGVAEIAARVAGMVGLVTRGLRTTREPARARRRARGRRPAVPARLRGS